jgi:CubicO group peptidase (beta-lactamase class C family)
MSRVRPQPRDRSRRRLRRPLRAAALSLLAALCAGTGTSMRAAARSGPDAALHSAVDAALVSAGSLPRLRSVLVAHRGRIIAERRHRGPPLDAPTNVKSVSKSVISALVGIAIAEGHLEGVDQKIAPFFARELANDPDPRKREITIGDLLTMRSGLERTSGHNYGDWVASRNWVLDAIRRPLLSPPGTQMMYSTGNTHLLSAILTRATGKSTHRYAQQKLAAPLGIQLPPWRKDPQGVYLGGNQMQLSPRAMLRFGELYRNRGVHAGRQVVPAAWVDASVQPRTRSPFSGQEYGYGWFISALEGQRMFYAWGYGGQFIFVLPDAELTIVTTSNPQGPRDMTHLGAIYDLIVDRIVPLFAAGAGSSATRPVKSSCFFSGSGWNCAPCTSRNRRSRP